MRISTLVLLLFAMVGCQSRQSPPIGADSTDAGKATTAFNEGVDFSNRKDWDTAISCYTEAIRLKPDLHRTWRNRGVAYEKKGDYDQAIRDYSEAIRLEPGEFLPWFFRGLAYEKLGNKAKANADFLKAEELKTKA